MIKKTKKSKNSRLELSLEGAIPAADTTLIILVHILNNDYDIPKYTGLLGPRVNNYKNFERFEEICVHLLYPLIIDRNVIGIIMKYLLDSRFTCR